MIKKMKNNLFKKSMSVFLACLMILSCWVFVPGEHNHASAASDDGTSVSSDLNADDSIIEMEEKAIISDADNDDNELSAEKSEQNSV